MYRLNLQFFFISAKTLNIDSTTVEINVLLSSPETTYSDKAFQLPTVPVQTVYGKLEATYSVDKPSLHEARVHCQLTGIFKFHPVHEKNATSNTINF